MPAGRWVLVRGEGGPHVDAHIHFWACKALTDFKNLAHCGWWEVERISISFTKWQACEQVLSLRHYHILKMKNQPFGALIRRKIDGLLCSQDTGGLKIKSREHRRVHFVLRYYPFFGLRSFYFSQKNGIEKSNSLCNKPPILGFKSIWWLNSKG